MKHFRTFALAILLTTICASQAYAQVGVMRSERKVWLDGVLANAAAGSRTFTLLASGGSTSRVNASGYNLAVVHIVANYTDGMTEISMVCSAADDDSTLFVLQDCDVVLGVCTSADASWVREISAADKNFVWRVDLTGFRYLSCVLTAANGTANETVTATGYLTSK